MKFVFISYNNYEEQILDGSIDVNKYIGTPFLVYLFKEIKEKGIEVISYKTWLHLENKTKKNYNIISEGVPQGLEALIKYGCNSHLIFCFEVPFYYFKYYRSKIITNFNYVLGFSELFFKYKIQGNFIDINYPGLNPEINQENYKNDNKLNDICYIASNKNFSFLKFRTIINIKFSILNLYYYIIDKKYRNILNYNNINQKYKIIFELSKKYKIHIYGRGWNNLSNLKKHQSNLILKNKNVIIHGEIENKYDILNQYKYCLIIENSILSNLVTEKLFDSIQANCIPIYFGANRVRYLFSDYIKANVNTYDIKDFNFLDIRNVDNYNYNLISKKFIYAICSEN